MNSSVKRIQAPCSHLDGKGALDEALIALLKAQPAG